MQVDIASLKNLDNKNRRLIEGMYNASHRYKIMEQQQIGNMSLNTCIDFIQQQELIQKYNHD